jgi:hypothetical protein
LFLLNGFLVSRLIWIVFGFSWHMQT